MKVSVIILTYNNWELIGTAIASILNQKYDNIEVIIQDDGTKGFSEEKIRSYFEVKECKLSNVIINTNNINLGTVKNYNSAIKKASGDIIIPLACDDSFYDEMVVNDIVNMFKTTGCEVCFSYRIGKQSNIILPDKTLINKYHNMTKKQQLTRVSMDNFICGATLYFKKSLYDKIGDFDEEFILLEDYPYVIKLLLKNVDIHFMDRITIIYNEIGVSSRNKKAKVINLKYKNDVKLLYEKYILPLSKEFASKKARRYYYYRYYKGYANINVFNKFLLYIKYIDILFVLFKNKINCIIKKNDKDKFDLLMD